MTFLPWSDDYKIHIRVIDNEHRELFDLINTLHDEFKEGKADYIVGSTLDALLRHAGEHFPSEDRYMKQCGFPGRARHVAEHARFERTVRHYREQFGRERALLDVEALLTFLKSWVTGHVLKSDLDMARYLRGDK